MHYPTPPVRVWVALADLASHHEWMQDADAVHFLTDQTAGVGTQLRVPTKVGPFRTTDLMTVVEWDEGKAITVDHQGAVSGLGRFEIRPSIEGTELIWSETLRFPWWLGGPIGAGLARPILKRVWGRNLSRLGERLSLTDL
ncbi:MAG TPA: SRPBCC family protein [Acidimicrobiia bacterium]